jgi:folylpolyglutamate synthase/dihydropteroate synthase
VLVELDIERAIERALSMATEDDLVVVAGSLYVAGAARPALRRLLSA